MAELIKINAHGLSNAFRIPLHMTVHDTFPLPMKTHIIGMMAAAMGIERSSSYIHYMYSNIMVGITGKTLSRYYDLITLYKFKGEKYPEISQLQRQMNYENNYIIYVYTENKLLHKIYEYLKNPVFALYLGKASEIINIKNVEIINKELLKNGKITISNTVIPFKIDDFDIEDVNNGNITPFTNYHVPSAFSLEKDYRVPINFMI